MKLLSDARHLLKAMPLALLACAVLIPPARVSAHHPTGVPQYRNRDGTIVMIYNVTTQDYIVRLVADPGRPVADRGQDVRFAVEISPQDPDRTFDGKTYVSLAEVLPDLSRVVLAEPEALSSLAGKRTVETSFPFDHPGTFEVKVDFVESTGREVLSFPITVSRGASGAREMFKTAGLAGGALGLLILAKVAAGRRKRRRGARVDVPGRLLHSSGRSADEGETGKQ